MDVLELDIETYSAVDLPKANVYAYSEDPSFEVLMCAWSLNDSPIEVAEDEGAIFEIPGLWDPDVKKVAHNAGFERVCFSRMRGMPVGEYLSPEEWFCTMAVASEYGLPRGLDALAKVLGAEAKDSAGARLISLFCKPNKHGVRNRPEDHPEKWEEFLAYCAQDVSTLQDVRRRMPGWPNAFERELWYVDQKINDRGMRVDAALAKAASEAAAVNAKEAEAEVISLTGVENPGSTQQLGKWAESVGLDMPNWQAETVTDKIKETDDPTIRRVLELRQELALVASNKFLAALRSTSMDGRLRGQFMFHAAHTGRWSSRGVQVHNLPRLSFTYKDADGEKHYDHVAEDIAINILLRCGGVTVPEDLKRLVRPMFIIDGAISDFSAIEARVLAWLAGEEWVLQAFRENRDLYVETAERMGGGMGRPEGKIAVLAAGYQGSVGSFRNMGYGGRKCARDTVKARRGQMSDVAWEIEKQRVKTLQEAGHEAELLRDPNHKCDYEIKEIVDAWRDANNNIRQFWYDLERKFWEGGIVGAGKIRVEVKGSRRLIHLPSGRVLMYHDVRKVRTKETNEITGEVTSRVQIAYRHVQGYMEKTYGGRLTENVTQAVARDLLADAMIRLDKAGYPIVGHVHDEAIVESKDLDGINAIMSVGPDWSEGLPMAAAGFLTYRYKKD